MTVLVRAGGPGWTALDVASALGRSATAAEMQDTLEQLVAPGPSCATQGRPRGHLSPRGAARRLVARPPGAGEQQMPGLTLLAIVARAVPAAASRPPGWESPGWCGLL